MLKIDFHIHSIASGHALGTINEIITYASEIGMEGIGVSDHSPGTDNTIWLSRQPPPKKRVDMRMNGPDFAYYSTFLSRYEKPKNISLSLFKGIECNILGEGDDVVDVPDVFAGRFDIVIASLHAMPYLFKIENQKKTTDRMIQAMSGPIDIIGHPYHKRSCPDMEPLVKAAIDNQIALELNNASIRRGKADMDAVILMLNLAKEYRCPVSVATDAHVVSEIGDFSDAVRALEEVDFPDDLIINRDMKTALEFVKASKIRRSAVAEAMAD